MCGWERKLEHRWKNSDPPKRSSKQWPDYQRYQSTAESRVTNFFSQSDGANPRDRLWLASRLTNHKPSIKLLYCCLPERYSRIKPRSWGCCVLIGWSYPRYKTEPADRLTWPGTSYWEPMGTQPLQNDGVCLMPARRVRWFSPCEYAKTI